ncbi:MAG: lasso peptide biosynthesis B2 protein [Vicinamibacteria bacterium]
MNRLESLRDVPDAAWSDPSRPSKRARRPGPPPHSRWSIPFRAARAAMRDPRRVWLMTRMAAAYAAISLLARVKSLPAAFAAVSPRLSTQPSEEAKAMTLVHTLDTMLAARLPLIHPQCWRRAALLHRFLRHEGIDTVIVFGVTTDATSGLEAHAWVERNGVPFAEAVSPTRYRRVFEFPGPRVRDPV